MQNYNNTLAVIQNGITESEVFHAINPLDFRFINTNRDEALKGLIAKEAGFHKIRSNLKFHDDIIKILDIQPIETSEKDINQLINKIGTIALPVYLDYKKNMTTLFSKAKDKTITNWDIITIIRVKTLAEEVKDYKYRKKRGISEVEPSFEDMAEPLNKNYAKHKK